MEPQVDSQQVLKIVKDVLNRTSDFVLSGEPEPGKHGLRVSLLKTGTLNRALDTTASVDHLRLILENELMKSGLRITGWTQSKFELVVDVDRDKPVKAGATSAA